MPAAVKRFKKNKKTQEPTGEPILEPTDEPIHNPITAPLHLAGFAAEVSILPDRPPRRSSSQDHPSLHATQLLAYERER